MNIDPDLAVLGASNASLSLLGYDDSPLQCSRVLDCKSIVNDSTVSYVYTERSLRSVRMVFGKTRYLIAM